jgi:hypothetical protein
VARIELQDVTGRAYVIDTSDAQTLGRWLVETLAKIGPTLQYEARLRVWPSDSGPGTKPDFPEMIQIAYVVDLDDVIRILTDAKGRAS